jgi:ATP-dependent helicase HrpA
VVDEHDRELARGHDLAELQRSLAPRAQELWAKAPRARHERAGLTRWDFDALPASVTLDVAGRRLTAYPALVDAETTVDLRLLETAAAAEAATRVALRRLALLDLRTSLTKLDAQVAGALAAGPLVVAGAPATPRRQVVLRALDDAFGITPADPLPRTRAAWEAQLDEGRRALPIALIDLSRVALAVHVELEKVRRLQKPLVGKPGLWKAAIDDIDSQLAHLITPELVRTVALARVEHLVRYLKAIQIRLERLALDPIKDQNKAAQVVPLWQRFHAELVARRARGRAHDELDEFGWLVEELRVAVFAPELRAAVPVSTQRLTELWATLAG